MRRQGGKGKNHPGTRHTLELMQHLENPEKFAPQQKIKAQAVVMPAATPGAPKKQRRFSDREVDRVSSFPTATGRKPRV